MRAAFLFLLFFSVNGFAQPELFAKIRVLKQEGKTEKSLQLITEQIEKLRESKDKKSTEEVVLLRFERSAIYFDLSKYDEVIAELHDLSQVKNNLAEYIHFQLANSYWKKGDLALARQHFQNVLNLSPNIKMQNDVKFSLAKIFISQKKSREAKFVLQKLERKNRREEIYPEIIYELAKAEKLSANFGQFCKWTKKLYSHYPEFPAILSWGLYHPNNQFEGKATNCPVTTEEKRARIKNLQWANLGQKAKEEIQFLKVSKEAAADEVEKLEISYLLHEGEALQVMNILKSQYQTHRGDPSFLMLLGNTAAKVGETQAAVGSFYQAYKLSPRGKFAKQALYQAAFMSYQFQDYDGAARKFQEFMKAYPNSGLSRDARWHLAWIRYLRGDYSGAYNAFIDLKKQVGRSRKHAKFFAADRLNFWIGMSLYRLGRFSDSRVIFENLAQDRLLGYYSITAKERLKKIDEYLPKLPKRILPDENMRLSRFSTMDALMPADDPEWFREVAQSKSLESDVTSATNSFTAEDAENEQELLTDSETRDRGVEVADGEIETEKVTNFANPVLVKRFERSRDLMILGLYDWAKWDLYDIERKTSNKEYLKTLMQEYEFVENYHRSSYIGQVNFGSQRGNYGLEGVKYLWEYTYPRAYANSVLRYAKEFNIPTELIWGIMRAESQYKKDVVSPVGALGLMQVMPVTANRMARTLGEKNFISKSLLVPDHAVRIGSKYLQQMMKKFDNNVALTAAAYNAGPHRVKSWISSFGQLDLDEFIEHIPYLETRNYVKKVLANFNVYNKLYNGKKDELSSTADTIKVRFSDPFPTKETWEDI